MPIFTKKKLLKNIFLPSSGHWEDSLTCFILQKHDCPISLVDVLEARLLCTKFYFVELHLGFSMNNFGPSQWKTLHKMFDFVLNLHRFYMEKLPFICVILKEFN